jgi:hypothetical protein
MKLSDIGVNQRRPASENIVIAVRVHRDLAERMKTHMEAVRAPSFGAAARDLIERALAQEGI